MQDDLTQDEKTVLLNEISNWMKTEEFVFDLDGPVMVTVKRADNTFRKKEVTGMSLYPVSAYQGAKDSIFSFEPEDAQEWVTAEISAKNMDQLVPLYSASLIKFILARFDKVLTEPERAEIQTFENTAKLLDLTFDLFKMNRDAEEKSDRSDLAVLPTFGMF